MNIKKLGNNYEQELLKFLRDKGYWCHLFAYSKNGQPCDIIALKNDKCILMDAKHCEGDYFAVSRIEPNQETCFKYLKKHGVNRCGFAIYFEKLKRWYWLPFRENYEKKSYKNIDMRELNEIDNF